MKLFLVALALLAASSAVLSEKASERQGTVVRRVVTRPRVLADQSARSARSRYGTRVASNRAAVSNPFLASASQPVGNVEFLEVQQPVQATTLPVASPVVQVQEVRAIGTGYGRAAPVGYFVEQQQQTRNQVEEVEEEEEEEVVEVAASRASESISTGYSASRAASEVVQSRAPASGYAAAAESRDNEEEEEEEEDDAEVQESRVSAVPTGYTAASSVRATAVQPETVYLVQQEARAEPAFNSYFVDQGRTAQPTRFQHARVLPATVQPAASRTRPQVAILRSSMNAPGTPGFERSFGYSFEAENGINQEAEGEMKRVGDADVMVMRGSYQYTDGEGERYEVSWYADETGYHPTATHLPKNPEIPFPEVREAVRAQLRNAAEVHGDEFAARAFNEDLFGTGAPTEIIEVRALPAAAASEAVEVVEVREIPQATLLPAYGTTQQQPGYGTLRFLY